MFMKFLVVSNWSIYTASFWIYGRNRTESLLEPCSCTVVCQMKWLFKYFNVSLFYIFLDQWKFLMIQILMVVLKWGSIYSEESGGHLCTLAVQASRQWFETCLLLLRLLAIFMLRHLMMLIACKNYYLIIIIICLIKCFCTLKHKTIWRLQKIVIFLHFFFFF